jgi:NADH:ubiquinone oxidoreductase subunit H
MLSLLFTFVFALIGMAFFTLCERKLLAAFQLRKGPNKVGFMGLIQAFADAGKLFTKQPIIFVLRNWMAYILAPRFLLFVAIFT